MHRLLSIHHTVASITVMPAFTVPLSITYGASPSPKATANSIGWRPYKAPPMKSAKILWQPVSPEFPMTDNRARPDRQTKQPARRE
jgi:hypothetical protein